MKRSWIVAERGLWCVFAALALWFAATPRAAVACGGPDYGNLGVLRPLDQYLSDLSYAEEDWQWSRAAELGFPYPLVKSNPQGFAELERYRQEEPTQAKLSLAQLDAAMAKGDSASTPSTRSPTTCASAECASSSSLTIWTPRGRSSSTSSSATLSAPRARCTTCCAPAIRRA